MVEHIAIRSGICDLLLAAHHHAAVSPTILRKQASNLGGKGVNCYMLIDLVLVDLSIAFSIALQLARLLQATVVWVVWMSQTSRNTSLVTQDLCTID